MIATTDDTVIRARVHELRDRGYDVYTIADKLHLTVFQVQKLLYTVPARQP